METQLDTVENWHLIASSFCQALRLGKIENTNSKLESFPGMKNTVSIAFSF